MLSDGDTTAELHMHDDMAWRCLLSIQLWILCWHWQCHFSKV